MASKAHNRLIQDILETCQAFGHYAFKIQVGAFQRENGFYRFGIRGQADVLCLIRTAHNFIPLWLEAKTGSGRQSEFQKSFQADVERRGHQYVVCRDSRELDVLFAKCQ